MDWGHTTIQGAWVRERGTHHGCRRPTGFTLVEVLISISMIALLLGIVLPVLGGALETGRQFKCSMSLRSVAMDFSAYADDMLHADRGDDQSLPRDTFYLETFQESQYSIDEFWAWGDVQVYSLPDAAGNNPMRCASVAGDLMLKRNTACSNGAVAPAANVSYGFNARLHRPEVEVNGQIKAPKVKLTTRILEHAMVPLLWDVDGRVADSKGVQPVFSAPSLDSELVYANDQYWFPGARHNGAINVAFVDGHVESSAAPLQESGWRWEFQPDLD